MPSGVYPRPRKDLTGLKAGEVEVLQLADKPDSRQSYWVCRCSCGNICEIRSDRLNGSEGNVSCPDCAKARQKNSVTRSGMSRTKVYHIWQSMKDRCLNPNCHAYEGYGGRGIAVCERWMSFDNFYSDMGDPPKGKSLDRINNDGNYEPDNCRWATRSEQQRNTRRTKR